MKKQTYEASDTAKREICSALKRLMAQRPLREITVAEITWDCGRSADFSRKRSACRA